MNGPRVATTAVTLPSGLRGTLLRRGPRDDDGPLLFHFHPNTEITVVICAICAWTVCLAGETAKQIARWAIDHFTNFTEAKTRNRKSEGVIHDGVRPDKSTLTATLTETLLGYDTLGSTPASVALSDADIDFLYDNYGIDLRGRMVQKELDRVCFRCYLPNLAETMCCFAERGKRLMLTACRAAPVAIYNPDDSKRLESLKSSQDSGRAIAKILAMQSAPKQVARQETGFFKADTVKGLMESERMLLERSLGEVVAVSTGDGSGRLMGIVVMEQGISRVVTAPVSTNIGDLDWMKEMTAKRVKVHDGTPFAPENDPLSTFVDRMELNRIPNELRLAAAEAISINMDDPKDRLIHKSVKALINATYSLIHECFPDYVYAQELHFISRAAQVREGKSNSRDSHARYAKDFIDKTGNALNEMVVTVSRIVKKIYSCETRNILNNDLHEVFDALSDNAEWEKTTDDRKIKLVSKAIGKMLESLVMSPDAGLVRELAGYLCLVLKDGDDQAESRAPRQAKQERYDDEDDDEDDEDIIADDHRWEDLLPLKATSSGGPSTSASKASKTVGVANIGTYRKGLVALLRIGKMILTLRYIDRFDGLIEAIGITSAEHKHIASTGANSESKLEMTKISCENHFELLTVHQNMQQPLLNDIKGTPFFEQMAHLIAAVIAIEGNSPSAVNGVKMEWSGPLGCALTVDGATFDPMDLRVMGNSLQAITLAALKSCLRNEPGKGDEVQAVLDKITHPDELWILSSPSPKLNTENKVVQAISRLAENAKRANLDGFHDSAESFRDKVLASVDLFGSSTIRTNDLCQIMLSRSKVMSLTLPDAKFAEEGLLFLTTITKTDRPGFTLLHPFLSRLLLVLLNLIVPLLFDGLKSEFDERFKTLLENLGESEDGGELKKAMTACWSLVTGHLCDRTTSRSKLSWKFKRASDELAKAIGTASSEKELRFDVTRTSLTQNNVVVLDLSPKAVIHQMNAAELNSILNDVVCAKSLLKLLSAPKRRKLLVSIRCYLPSMIEELYKKELRLVDEPSLNAYRNLVDCVQKATQGIQASATSGQHSLQTAQGNYLPGVLVATPHQPMVKVGQIGYDVASLVTKGIHLFYSLPGARRSASHSQPPQGRRQSVLERHVAELRDTGAESEERIEDILSNGDIQDELLIGKLRVLTGNEKAEWASRGQAKAALLGLVSRRDLVVSLDTGEGKTLSVLTALACESRGGVILYVCHLQNLLEDMIITWRDRYKLNVQLSSDVKSCLRSSTFEQSWPASGPTRYVMVTVDQLQDETLYQFVIKACLDDRLRAFVVDEAHATTMTLTYRSPPMRRLMALARLASKSKRVLISGTFPKLIRDVVLGRFGIYEGEYDVVFSEVVDAEIPRRAVTVVDPMPLPPTEAAIIFLQHLAKKPGRVVVFCPTKLIVSSIARASREKIVPANGVELIVKERVSRDSAQTSKDFLKTSREPLSSSKFTIFVGTSVLVEGWDPVDIGTIIVVGGIFGGLLLLQQAASRCGRGRRSNGSGPLPQCLVLQSSGWIVKEVFGTREKMSDIEHLACSVVGKKEMPEAQQLLTMSSVDRLLKPVMCPARILAKACKDESEGAKLKDCGECSFCNSSTKMFFESMFSRSSGGSKLVVAVENPHLLEDLDKRSSEQARLEEIADGEQMQADGTQFFREAADDDRCILCPPDSRSKAGRFHLPNDCPKIRMFLSRKNCCFQCGQFGHRAGDMSATLNVGEKKDLLIVENVPKKEVKVPKEKVPAALMECAYVGMSHPNYDILRPCSTCWLCHVPGDGSCRVPVKGRKLDEPTASNMRACVVLVWWNTELRKRFLFVNDLAKDDRFKNDGNIEGAFMQFLFWAVYEKHAGVQNLYRVLLFVKDYISETKGSKS